MNYGICDECGTWDVVGYLACEDKHLCPGCAAKRFHETPQTIRAALVTKIQIKEFDELNIDYACRALLGGGKGQSVMEQWLRTNPEYHAKIMAEAKKRLAEAGKAPDIVYCEKCGEYLGDRIDGILFKFGKAVTEIHRCQGVPSGNLPEL
jgi:hypothetical protein